MSFDFDTVVERRGSDGKKWSRYAADVLPMWVADMDFAVAPEIVEALRERLAHPVFGYAAAGTRLRERVVAHCGTHYDWTVDVDDIVFLPGVEPGFNMALKALTTPGDGVVVNTPVYRPMLTASDHWGLERIEVPLLPDERGGYGVDPAQSDAALARAAVLLLCNPHNPTGHAFRRDELETLARACLAHDTWIVSDEIHCDLLYDGRRHVPIASLDPEVAARTITLMATSKTFNLAGLKTAFAIVPNAALRARFDAARLGLVDSVNLFGLAATEAALEHGEPWRRALIAYLSSNRDHLASLVESRLPGVRMTKPEATFLAWLDCSALGLPVEPQAFFLDHGRVALSAGAEFGDAYRSWVRLNFGCARAVLDEGIERLAASLARR